MKILRPFTGTGCVFFPIGLPPMGTCEFATKKCIQHCYANLTITHSNFDEEVIIPESEKKEIYKQFMEYPKEWLREEVLRELDGLQTPILHWFGSGDCLVRDMDRITELIEFFSCDLVQMGFTRNVELWHRHKDIFALTVERIEDCANLDESGMFSIPNYRKQQTVMHKPSKQVRGGYCGPLTCEDAEEKDLEHYINCRTCRRLHTGCFDR